MEGSKTVLLLEGRWEAGILGVFFCIVRHCRYMKCIKVKLTMFFKENEL
jgi:hypothetical protein